MVVEASGLGYWHGGRGRGSRGFEGIDLRVEAGRIVGVLGPNGAGKSTLLRVLATLLRASAGELLLFGADAAQPDAALRRRIGYAADEPVHFAQLTGRENVIFFARAAGLAAGDAATAAAAWLERFGVGSDADRAAGEYSYGTRRKLLLCAAFAGERALLLLDEPTIGLDLRARDALSGVLASAASEGSAVVLATNDLAFAQTSCDSVILLNEGHPVAAGSPAALLARVGESVWIEVTLAVGSTPQVALAGIEVIDATPGHLVVRSRVGTSALPALCAELLARGCDIRGVQVRETDLRDVFHAVTGLGWTPESAVVRDA